MSEAGNNFGGDSGEAWPLDVNPTADQLDMAASFAAKAGFEMSDPASEAIFIRELAELIAVAQTTLSDAEVGEDYDTETIVEGHSIRVYGIQTHDGPQFFIGGKPSE